MNTNKTEPLYYQKRFKKLLEEAEANGIKTFILNNYINFTDLITGDTVAYKIDKGRDK